MSWRRVSISRRTWNYRALGTTRYLLVHAALATHRAIDVRQGSVRGWESASQKRTVERRVETPLDGAREERSNLSRAVSRRATREHHMIEDAFDSTPAPDPEPLGDLPPPPTQPPTAVAAAPSPSPGERPLAVRAWRRRHPSALVSAVSTIFDVLDLIGDTIAEKTGIRPQA